MTIAVVSGAHIIGSSATSDTFTTSSVDTTGATFLVAAVVGFAGSPDPVFSDSKGCSWTALTKITTGVGNALIIYYSASPNVGTGHTFTATGTTIYASIAVQGFTGVHTSPLDQQNGATGTGPTLQTGSVSPSQDNELIVTAIGGVVDDVLSIDSGFTITDQALYNGASNYGLGLAYIIKGASTSGVSVNPTWTKPGAQPLSAEIGTFKIFSASASRFGFINNPAPGGI